MTTLSRRIEAILFTRDEAVSEALLAQALDVSEDAIRAALLVLEARYEASAMMLVRLAGGWRLQLRPAFFPAVAVIAYHQPVTRAEIDAVRGVTTSSGIYRQLFELEWIEVIGTKEVPGRPELLATTAQFLSDFSVASLEDLPALPDDGFGGSNE